MKFLGKSAAMFAVAALSITSLSACGNNANSSDEKTAAADQTLTVWVMQDDYDDKTLEAINTKFTEQTGAKVDIQVQQWDGITTKLDTALSTADTPDVIDIGNTMVADYAATGALLDLTADKEDLSQGQTWQAGLEDPATFEGALYAVPSFGGNRAVIYNKKMWEEAGITAPPTTYAELTAALDKLASAHAGESDFSPLYLPGQNLYSGLQFVWDRGGEIATNSEGKWTGAMKSSEALAGLKDFQDFQNKYSTVASRTVSIDNPEQEKSLQMVKLGLSSPLRA